MHYVKRFSLFIIFCCCTAPVTGQDFKIQWRKLSHEKDIAAQQQLLTSWEKTAPKDPDMFIGWFNYYASKSKTDVISLEKEPHGQQSLVVNDSATGKAVGYMNSNTGYNMKELQKGFDYIDRGIVLYPDRLDMIFGKIYMLGEAGNYRAFTDALKTAIEYGVKHKHNWHWANNETVNDPEQFFLSSIQDYSNTIYNTNNDSLLPLMREINEAVLKYYPDHVESLSNVAITYMVAGNYDAALEYLLRAEKAAPKDMIVLNNIAEAYHRKKDNTNAKIYYEKMIQNGKQKDADYAREKIKSLN